MFSRRMKQLIATVLTVTMLGTIAPAGAFAATPAGDAGWVNGFTPSSALRADGIPVDAVVSAKSSNPQPIPAPEGIDGVDAIEAMLARLNYSREKAMSDGSYSNTQSYGMENYILPAVDFETQIANKVFPDNPVVVTDADQLGAVLDQNYYVFKNDVTLQPKDGNQNGISIAEGKRVVLEIKENVTVTVQGANGTDSMPGGAGIYVPESSTLVVIGPGTLEATGGDAGNGGNGQNGKSGSGGSQDTTVGAWGGNGGHGGHGAGAGIGGYGAIGAEGGNGGNSQNMNGSAGNNSTDGTPCGEIYFLNRITVNASAGKETGETGKTGTPGDNAVGEAADVAIIGGGGAGGGGKPGMAPAFGIGYGGNGGASGGGGGAGGILLYGDAEENIIGNNGALADAIAVNKTSRGGNGGDGGFTVKADPDKATGKVYASFDSHISGRNEGDIERGNYVLDEDGQIRDVFAKHVSDIATFKPENGGVYRFDSVIDYQAPFSENAITIPEKSKVILEFSTTADVTLRGGDSQLNLGAGAGIYVPESSTLIIRGNGKLTAIGGNAGNASIGGDGTCGGGAGAGIGGMGGNGESENGRFAVQRGKGCGDIYILGSLVLDAQSGEEGTSADNYLGGRAPEYGIGGGGAGGWTIGHTPAMTGNNGKVYIDYASTHVSGRTHYVHNANIDVDIMGNVILGGYTDMIHGYFDSTVDEAVLYQAILQVANHGGLKKGEGWKVFLPDSDDPDNSLRDDNLKYQTVPDFCNMSYRVGNDWHKNIVDLSGGYVYLFSTILGRYAKTRIGNGDNPRDLGTRCWNNVKNYAQKNNLYISEDMHALFEEVLFYQHYGEPFGGKRASLYIKNNPTSGRHRHASDALQQIDYSYTNVLDKETARCATISYDTLRSGTGYLAGWEYWFYKINGDSFQCTDGYIGVTPSNWMKTIPGNASLAEINMPGTHDAGTAHTIVNDGVLEAVPGLIADHLDYVAVVLDGIGVISTVPVLREIVATLTAAATVYLMIRIPLFLPYLAESIASCQSMDIEEQLNSGIRVMDVRVAYNLNVDDKLDSLKGEEQFKHAMKMLKLSHGTLGDGGEDLKKTVDHDVTLTDCLTGSGSRLSFLDVVNDCETFLQKNKQETVVLLLQKEGNLDENNPNSHYMRAKRAIFSWLEQQKSNPDNHIFALKNGDEIPTLDKARGNIYIICQEDYSKYEDNYDVSAEEKIKLVTKVLDEATAIPGGYKGIPQDYTKQHTVTKGSGNDAGFPKVVFTSTYHLSFNGAKFVLFNDCFTGTPKQIAKNVNSFLNTYGFRRGMHYGWFMMNNPTGMAISNIYFSNLFSAKESMNGIKPGEEGSGPHPDPTPDPEPYYGGGGTSDQPGIIVTPTDNTEVSIQNNVPGTVLNKVTAAAAQDNTVSVVGGSDTAVNVTAKDKDGNILTGFTDPLVVSIPLTSAEVKQAGDTSKLTIAKVDVDANGKTSFTYMGGSYDAETGRITAFVDEPGNYVVLTDSDITKLELQIDNPNYNNNDSARKADVAPIIHEERTLVPLRLVAENLGCNVDWNEATRTVTIQKDGVTLTMTIDQIISGFDVAPIIYKDRTMVPIRYIAEQLKANVIWVPKTQQIVIVK